MKAVSNESVDLFNDTSTLSPSPLAEMASGVGDELGVSFATPFQNIQVIFMLMLHHLAGATIQVANLVNYKPFPFYLRRI